MATEDGNVQEMDVQDKSHPALAATHEAQDVSTTNPVLVPMPAFTNPNNPLTSAGSINLDLDEHPVEHSPDFGEGYIRHSAPGVEDTHAKSMRDAVEVPGPPGRRETAVRKAQAAQVEYPENRDDWQKKHWQAKAREFNLSVSGNTDAVKDRVEEHEGQIESVKGWNAGDWQGAIADAETADDLAELRSLYGTSGAEFSTVAKAFDDRQAEFDNDES